jgi:hypothetical protein
VSRIICSELEADKALAVATFAAVFLYERLGGYGAVLVSCVRCVWFGWACIVWGAAVFAAGPACTDNLLLSLCLACPLIELWGLCSLLP